MTASSASGRQLTVAFVEAPFATRAARTTPASMSGGRRRRDPHPHVTIGVTAVGATTATLDSPSPLGSARYSRSSRSRPVPVTLIPKLRNETHRPRRRRRISAGRWCLQWLPHRARRVPAARRPGYAIVPRLLGIVAAEAIDAVLVSHGHPDHVADLNPLLRARLMQDDEAPRTAGLRPAGCPGPGAGARSDQGPARAPARFTNSRPARRFRSARSRSNRDCCRTRSRTPAFGSRRAARRSPTRATQGRATISWSSPPARTSSSPRRPTSSPCPRGTQAC